MKLPESAAESLLQSNFYLIQLGWGEGELEVEVEVEVGARAFAVAVAMLYFN